MSDGISSFDEIGRERLFVDKHEEAVKRQTAKGSGKRECEAAIREGGKKLKKSRTKDSDGRTREFNNTQNKLGRRVIRGATPQQPSAGGCQLRNAQCRVDWLTDPPRQGTRCQISEASAEPASAPFKLD